MAQLFKNVKVSPEEYLEGETYATVKHEYVDGYIYAMLGTSKAHNLIASSLLVRLHPHLRGTPCRVFMADIKVRIATANIFYYPDLLVTCGKDEKSPYYSDCPVVVVEVLSPSTQKLDETDKWVNYRTLDSLKEYVLIAQDKIEVKIYRRNGAEWDMEALGPGDILRLDAVEFQVPIEALYEDVLV